MDTVWFIGVFVVGLFTGMVWAQEKAYARVRGYQDRALAALNHAERVIKAGGARADRSKVNGNDRQAELPNKES